MSDPNYNAFSAFKVLKDNNGATAAAVELVNAACRCSSGSANTTQALDWAIKDNNLQKLRDKIKECASND